MSLITKTQHSFDSLLLMNDKTKIKINVIDTCQHPNSFFSIEIIVYYFATTKFDFFDICYVELFLKGWKSNICK